MSIREPELFLGLPLSIIEQLGLPTHTQGDRDALRWESTGASTVWRVAYPGGDRDDVFSCVAKPEGAPLLLGQIVLEALDLVVDCGRQRLIPNPEAPDGMMLYEDY